jgi:hypothetical protein
MHCRRSSHQLHPLVTLLKFSIVSGSNTAAGRVWYPLYLPSFLLLLTHTMPMCHGALQEDDDSFIVVRESDILAALS